MKQPFIDAEANSKFGVVSYYHINDAKLTCVDGFPLAEITEQLTVFLRFKFFKAFKF